MVFYFTGDKGGVGKSMVARVAVQYHLDRSIDCTVFECDRSNPDVYRIYSNTIPCQVAVFSEGSQYEDAANNILNSALTSRVLVNMPAQTFNAFSKWLNDNDILSICAEEGITLTNLFVSDGGYDSLNLLKKYLTTFGEGITHVLIKNWGRCQDWSGLDEDEELQSLLTTYQVPVLDFPAFIGTSTRNRIDGESLTFADARESTHLGAIGRQRVKKFLREAYTAFDTAEVFSHD